jgi:hypothetical protein
MHAISFLILLSPLVLIGAGCWNRGASQQIPPSAITLPSQTEATPSSKIYTSPYGYSFSYPENTTRIATSTAEIKQTLQDLKQDSSTPLPLELILVYTGETFRVYQEMGPNPEIQSLFSAMGRATSEGCEF